MQQSLAVRHCLSQVSQTNSVAASSWLMDHGSCQASPAWHNLDCTTISLGTAGVLKHAEQDAGPHLIVAPASLLENWQRELQRWCPGLDVVTYYGSDRAALRQQLLYNRCVSAAHSDCLVLVAVPCAPCAQPFKACHHHLHWTHCYNQQSLLQGTQVQPTLSA